MHKIIFQLTLALFAGALAVTAFAPFRWWPVVFLSLATLLLLWKTATPRQALLSGYFFGLGLFGVGASWVYNSIHVFGHAPVWLAAILTILFIAALAFFPALVGWFQARYFQYGLFNRFVLVIPALWVLSEWMRGWVLTGFPWLYLGNTQLLTVLKNIAPITGVLGVSWLVMMLTGLVLMIFYSTGRQRWTSVIIAFLLLTVSLLTGLIRWTEPYGSPIKVTLVQGNIAQENKWKREWQIPTLKRYNDLTVKNWDSDLVVWPEVAIPGYYQNYKKAFLDPLAAAARDNNTDILLGALYAEEDRAYNSVIQIGNGFGVYKKRHLVMFGEYIPLRQFLGWLDGLIVLPASDMSRSDKPVILEAAGQRFSSSICYEDAFGQEMADMLPEATLLLNISNDAWFGDSLAPHQHLEIAQMRSLELGRDMLRANNTGITAFIDYRGDVRKSAPQFTVTALTDTAQPRQGRTPYVLWENTLIVTVMLALIMFGYVLNRASRANRILAQVSDTDVS